MYRCRVLPMVLSSAFSIACEEVPTAPDGPAAGSSVPVLRTQAPDAVTFVDIKSQHLIGTLPNGVAVDVNVNAQAQGADPSALIGDGRHFASTGAHSYWPASGSTDGTRVTLSGAVADSNTPFLIGSPVVVEADASTDAITLRFGPLAGGPFAGQTLIFSGTGKATIGLQP